MAQEYHPHNLRFKKNKFGRGSNAPKAEDRIKHIPKRIFDDVEIFENFDEDNVLSLLENVFKPIGMHVKKLMLVNFNGLGPVTNFSKFLKLFPNVNDLTFLIEILNEYRQVNLTPVAVTLPKLKRLDAKDCSQCVNENVINHININGPFLEEMRLEGESSLYFQIPLLKMHQSTLKKLEIDVGYNENVQAGYNSNLMDFIRIIGKLEFNELESLKLKCKTMSITEEPFEKFLKKHAKNLIELTIQATYFEDSLLNRIFNMENLQVLEIESFEYKSDWDSYDNDYEDDDNVEEEKDDFYKTSISTASTDNLQKLGKLSKLKFNNFYGCNILSGLGLAVNENLLELEANFDEVTEDFMLQLPNYIPNIKKLIINRWPHEHIDSLKHFKKLSF
jgi:hypothetical protein